MLVSWILLFSLLTICIDIYRVNPSQSPKVPIQPYSITRTVHFKSRSDNTQLPLQNRKSKQLSLKNHGQPDFTGKNELQYPPHTYLSQKMDPENIISKRVQPSPNWEAIKKISPSNMFRSHVPGIMVKGIKKSAEINSRSKGNMYNMDGFCNKNQLNSSV